jgi:hypothetical protein
MSTLHQPKTEINLQIEEMTEDDLPQKERDNYVRTALTTNHNFHTHTRAFYLLCEDAKNETLNIYKEETLKLAMASWDGPRRYPLPPFPLVATVAGSLYQLRPTLTTRYLTHFRPDEKVHDRADPIILAAAKYMALDQLGEKNLTDELLLKNFDGEQPAAFAFRMSIAFQLPKSFLTPENLLTEHSGECLMEIAIRYRQLSDIPYTAFSKHFRKIRDIIEKLRGDKPGIPFTNVRKTDVAATSDAITWLKLVCQTALDDPTTSAKDYHEAQTILRTAQTAIPNAA